MTEQDKPQASEATFAFIPLDQLSPNTYNARRFTDMTPQRKARFEELTASVREKGVIEPLLVRPLGENSFEVIAGERRYRAALIAAEQLGIEQGEYKLPCMKRDISEDDAFDLMLIENLQRDDLTPFETAQAFKDYLARHGNTAEAAAELSFRTGIPAHAIRRQVRLLDQPEAVLTAWNEGKITQSHAEMFTRLDDPGQVLELLAACIRLKLSTRELAERIGAISPDLEKAFFDKSECQACHFNGAVQSGLFADVSPGGKCGKVPCYEDKQGAFFAANWLQSKAADSYGTRGFRFGHRLGSERCEPIIFDEIAGRCLECDRFVSILRLNGAVVGGYARSCTGPVACFEELYRKGAETASANPQEKQGPADSGEEPREQEPSAAVATCIGCGCTDDHACEGGCSWVRIDRESGKGVCSKCPASIKKWDAVEQKPAAPPSSPPPKSATKKPATPPPAKQQTSPVYNAPRGERFRETFFKEAIPARVKECDPGDNLSLRLAILALALASTSAKACIAARLELPSNIGQQQLAEKIFELPGKAVLDELQTTALAHVLDHSVTPAVRGIVAANFAIDLKTDWTLGKDYLDSLTKSEIVSIGEERLVSIWGDEKAQAYRKEHHKGKALISLKKEELMDIILKSGAELKGVVPAEVIGVRG
jgi:ParB/RepB/Spo0J family partition protein